MNLDEIKQNENGQNMSDRQCLLVKHLLFTVAITSNFLTWPIIKNVLLLTLQLVLANLLKKLLIARNLVDIGPL